VAALIFEGLRQSIIRHFPQRKASVKRELMLSCCKTLYNSGTGETMGLRTLLSLGGSKDPTRDKGDSITLPPAA